MRGQPRNFPPGQGAYLANPLYIALMAPWLCTALLCPLIGSWWSLLHIASTSSSGFSKLAAACKLPLLLSDRLLPFPSDDGNSHGVLCSLFSTLEYRFLKELEQDDKRMEDQGSPRPQQDLWQGWQEGRRRRVLENLQQGMELLLSLCSIYVFVCSFADCMGVLCIYVGGYQQGDWRQEDRARAQGCGGHWSLSPRD
jgi:hypothetical protein